jgi:hypothetical protein
MAVKCWDNDQTIILAGTDLIQSDSGVCEKAAREQLRRIFTGAGAGNRGI